MRPRLRGYVWWCGDEYCDCTEPRIEVGVPDTSWSGWRWDLIWKGTFHTDSESGAVVELGKVHKKMKRVWPEADARIEWKWPT